MKAFARLGILAALLIGSSTATYAQPETAYPSKPIKFILPSSPGGGGDMVGRLIGDSLSKRLGQPVIIENNAGASGTIAITQLSKAPADGYTIGLGTMTSTTLAPTVYSKLPYDPVKDLTTIAGIGTSPIVLLVRDDVPVKNLKEFLDYARKLPQPLQYGTWGLGSTGHFCAEVLSQKTGVKLSHVPYKGSAPVMTAMLGGEIHAAWLDMATGTAAVRSGKIRPVALCTRPTAGFPNVGTYKDQGVDFDQWTGWAMFAPPNMPKPILDKLANAVKETITDPAVSSKLLGWGITAEFIPGEQRSADNAKDIQAWRKIASDAGMKFE